MTVTTGDGLQLTNSSNTFYISKLRAEAPVEKTIQFSVLPNAEQPRYCTGFAPAPDC